MTEFTSLLQGGTDNAWLFIPSAILLGALHGLEPGHSKTMMAAFIVAIRGTVLQAVLLGMAATVSHTAIVWLVALPGAYFGSHWEAESSEPYFQLASAVLILAVAVWMLVRTWRQQHHHAHEHGHDHAGKPNGHIIDPGHSHSPPGVPGRGLSDSEALDPHALAHAGDIRRRFANRQITTGQIILFGLTGGLIPCSAAIAVLLMCLQLKRIVLGAVLVLGFSIGLALTLILSGAIAAVGVRQVTRRWSNLDKFARRAPYFSGALIILVGLYVGYHGLMGILG